MKTYIRLFGPELKSAIERLEDLSIIHEELVHQKSYLPLLDSSRDEDHLKILQQGHIFIGSYDFVFTWKQPPSDKDLNNLITEIDASFKDLSVHYTITTVPEDSISPETYVKLPEDWHSEHVKAISFLVIYGPPLLELFSELDKLSEQLSKDHTLPVKEGQRIRGRYDFGFAWTQKPSTAMILELTTRLDDVFRPRNAFYSIETINT